MFEQYIVNEYARTSIIFIGAFLIISLALILLQKLLLKLTNKTKTDIDDRLLSKTFKPLILLSLFFAFRISIIELTLDEMMMTLSIRIIHSLIAIVIAYIIYVTFDLVILTWFKYIARKTKSRLDHTVLTLFSSTINVSVVIIIFLYILSLWGVEIGPLLAGLGIAGIAIALGLQPILGNIFSGASIVLDQSVRVGDLVYIDKTTGGKIEKIGFRSTKIKTFDNEYLIVPNSKLAESNIQNVALPEPRTRVVLPFGVAYGSDIEKVKKIVLDEIKKSKNIEFKPDEPVVRFLEMGDSSLNFKAYFYIDTFDNRLDTMDEVYTRIYNSFKKEKIEIPFPQMDVHMKK
ncbi:MAG: MscS Mechanosensitive ion channel [archaeon GW2011_AR13]|nr:MAG: MscS Mechanosensitive ion channel [archaeon GW2011_AR13]MBS3064468.1 mechanosensitive ion channel family protein [DPANN group archaeon]HIG95105.1 mechanosensitive ion channel family protein [Nanoarchaeota archaeon]HIH63187.1 mechanosensitive ion channel family protein [Nanoarchaeota archaeon]HIJ09291.1 mechanosensitive ion channel family protein [Nanoarchaeota archaeon]